MTLLPLYNCLDIGPLRLSSQSSRVEFCICKISSLKTCEVPVIVPPVPTPATKASILPLVAVSISFAVVFL